MWWPGQHHPFLACSLLWSCSVEQFPVMDGTVCVSPDPSPLPHTVITSYITGGQHNCHHPSLTARLSKHKICDPGLFYPRRKILIKGKIFTRQSVQREEIAKRTENILLLSAKDDESRREKQERNKERASFDVCCILRMILYTAVAACKTLVLPTDLTDQLDTMNDIT